MPNDPTKPPPDAASPPETPQCPRCGYDLRAHAPDAPCPECKWESDPHAERFAAIEWFTGTAAPDPHGPPPHFAFHLDHPECRRAALRRLFRYGLWPSLAIILLGYLANCFALVRVYETWRIDPNRPGQRIDIAHAYTLKRLWHGSARHRFEHAANARPISQFVSISCEPPGHWTLEALLPLLTLGLFSYVVWRLWTRGLFAASQRQCDDLMDRRSLALWAATFSLQCTAVYIALGIALLANASSQDQFANEVGLYGVLFAYAVIGVINAARYAVGFCPRPWDARARLTWAVTGGFSWLLVHPLIAIAVYLALWIMTAMIVVGGQLFFRLA